METQEAGKQAEDTTTASAETLKAGETNSVELRNVEVQKSPEVENSEIPSKPERLSYPKPEVIEAPERLSSLMPCFKYGLIVITFALLVLGIIIIGVAAWVKADPDFWNIRTGLDLRQFTQSANIAIVVGIVIFAVGFIGFCGAIKENMCLLMVYFVIALLLIILEITAVAIVWSATNNSEFRGNLAKVIREGVDRANEKSSEAETLVDIIQQKFQCCGVQGIDEYKGNPPRSCSNPVNFYPYTEGCLDKLLNYLKAKAALIGGITIMILLVQIGGLAISVLFYCVLRQASSKVF